MSLYKTDVYTGNKLKNHISIDKDKNKRFLINDLDNYLHNNNSGKVCILYGLRRTGKTTMIRQYILSMDDEMFNKTAFISLNKTDDIGKLRNDLNTLFNDGYRYVFIDEITLLDDFITVANIYSDIYATDGMKIVLTGTDSLGFYFANKSSLYNRSIMIHTTFIPFNEFNHIFPDKNIDDYIEYGGTLVKERDESNPFYSADNSNEYVDSAIAHNIQHSLECYNDGKYFIELSELYNYNELTNVINRFIQRKNREFVINIITKKFKSADYGSTYQLLETKLAKESTQNPMDSLDKEKIRQSLMKSLDIFDIGYGKIKVTQEIVDKLNQYLERLDIIKNYYVLVFGNDIREEKHTLFTQAGMRYSQAKELYSILAEDIDFRSLKYHEQELILKIMDNDVKGNILEELVLANVIDQMERYNVNNILPNYNVYQALFNFDDDLRNNGEIDMVIQDNKHDCLFVFEIKHSSHIDSNQYKHLINNKIIDKLESSLNKRVARRYVLYLGDNYNSPNEIQYLNINCFLKEFSEEWILKESGKATNIINEIDNCINNISTFSDNINDEIIDDKEDDYKI